MTTPAQQMGVPTPELALGQSTLAVATWAARAYSSYDHESVRRIATAAARAGAQLAEDLARAFVEDTGYGVAQHLAQEIVATCNGFIELAQTHDYVSPRLGPVGWSVPRPVGVVLALPGSTTAVTDILNTVLQCLLTRNAVVVCLDSSAQAVSCTVTAALAAAARAAGAPEWTVAWLDQPSVELVDSVAGDSRVCLVRRGRAATGGIPVIVDSTADLALAGQRIVRSVAFNNSLSSTAERMLITVDDIAADLLDQLGKAGAQLLNAAEADRLRRAVFPAGQLDPHYIGQCATWIAEQAGILVEPTTTVLLVPVELVVPDEPLTQQNQLPVVGFVGARNTRQAISTARAVVGTPTLDGYSGPCAAIHSNNPTTILDFSTTVQARRIIVNHGCNRAGFVEVGPDLVQLADISWVDSTPAMLPELRVTADVRSPSGPVPTYPFASNDPRFGPAADGLRR